LAALGYISIIFLISKDDLAEAQKRREQQKKLEDAKKIAAQKGPMSKLFSFIFNLNLLGIV